MIHEPVRKSVLEECIQWTSIWAESEADPAPFLRKEELPYLPHINST